MNDNKTLADFLPKLNTEGELILGDLKDSALKPITKQDVIDKILLIDDPELGINIYDLGLIYELNIENNNIEVLMTLTTVNCPVADTMPNDIAKKIATIDDCGQIKVKLTFDPPWTKDMMSEDAKLALGF
ncbi:MAG: metal-sulfur cluster assembly factor [Alphaproteobacteria bacterium]|jgi:metal-sulfur cluster biosynthetic enzyme|nr:iron-sulfur cluster assembly protein [Pseudomonadota bacterium]|tara:strand:- start:159 stop:548 length:390 start_codon:yes stop_codon:yes gene_type:complete